MNFIDSMEIVNRSLKMQNIILNPNKYDGLIVKILQASNTLDLGRTTNQTHIAITGQQMDIFPSIQTNAYHYSVNPNVDMKKYFIGTVDVFLSEKNVGFLNGDNLINKEDNDRFIDTSTAVVRNVRSSQADQIQLSILDVDGNEFIEFRKIMHVGFALIILKRKSVLEYEIYGVEKSNPYIGELYRLNNNFYYQKSNTIVNMSEAISKNCASSSCSKIGGENILLYGVPGSGKSYTIEQEYCSDESKIERIVFHPDYMNTDFIGQILPTIKEDKTITYEFTPGPFTRIVEKAYKNPSEMYYLIIEEINRGNAPAIFGDIFQLLDRDKDGSSSYSIKNYNVANIVYGNEEIPISIPSNLTILATMNTADQNVFTLDTAFQRRWIMRLIKNDVSKAEHAKVEILDTGVTWEVFNNTINNFILANNSSTMSSEDKRLGAYFITQDILELDKSNLKKFTSKEAREFHSVFAEKVIKYLWDDAFKFARNKLFDPNYRSLEKVIDDFADFNGFDRFDIFTGEVKNQLKSNLNVIESETKNQEIEETKED